jgi:hypothetical protein
MRPDVPPASIACATVVRADSANTFAPPLREPPRTARLRTATCLRPRCSPVAQVRALQGCPWPFARERPAKSSPPNSGIDRLRMAEDNRARRPDWAQLGGGPCGSRHLPWRLLRLGRSLPERLFLRAPTKSIAIKWPRLLPVQRRPPWLRLRICRSSTTLE